MGAWGIQPEECDRGDDWLINLWRDTDIFLKINATLELDYHGNHEEIRVAISLAVSIERFGMIPPAKQNYFWARSLDLLRCIKSHDVYQIDEFQQIIASEIQQLELLISERNS